VKMRSSIIEDNSSYKLPYLRKYIKKFSSPLSGPFSLYTTSKGRQVQRPASQGRAMALKQFFPWLLISVVKHV
jgi:hypothetical protein